MAHLHLAPTFSWETAKCAVNDEKLELEVDVARENGSMKVLSS